ncbi:NAD(P)H-hydrate epimerase [Halopenitus malekzadehii]|uniref:Bifunctional NAD(P)H-hydrate repair enzyme n=1 Tax=Halopenitus malekzadehii TaxID=1267564 RepID=A0A1H6IYV3_9EURY|nr:NAD(P)H-hydrate dehydratase [Halopenitus malekzadehii]SEH54771.1 NAD(P)H-hydrate epimerase [Halopenitus malekzadehii]
MITADRMAAVDANAAALGVPRKQLMESAGNAIAREVRTIADPGATVTVVCGRGNNGGDAFVAARFLSEYDVRVRLLGRSESISTAIARENWDALDAAEIDAEAVVDPTGEPDRLALWDADVIVDAMLGTGVSGPLREPERTVAKRITEAASGTDTAVLAVDVPSGVDADTGEIAVGPDGERVAVPADRIVTFHDAKPGLASATDAEATVAVADIGIPDAAELFTGPGDLLGLDRDPMSHKGDHGEVLIVGGGPYTGAPTLAARAALRAGADLVHVACPESIAREVQGFSENLIVHGFPGEILEPEHLDRISELASGRDVVVFGPGLGDADPTLTAVERFLEAYDGRAVIDADALQVVPNVETDATLVCTPHQGELRAMGGPSADDWRERSDLVREFAADLGQTVLVKGAYDVITDGENLRVNRTGNPGMTVGGTGDVLAGAVGAVACTQRPLQAAAIGAYANGRAGDLVVEDQGYGLVATDLIDRIPEAVRTDA